MTKEYELEVHCEDCDQFFWFDENVASDDLETCITRKPIGFTGQRREKKT